MKKVLVIVDMQKDFVDGSLGTPDAVEIVDRVVKKIAGFSGSIFVTYDTHFADYSQTAEGKKLPVPHCIRGTDGWQLDSKIAAALDGRAYTTLEKITFGSVELPNRILEAVGDEPFSVELVGLCTDICVVSNALLLKAHFPQIEISVDSACCAGVTPETHKAALDVMKMCQIRID